MSPTPSRADWTVVQRSLLPGAGPAGARALYLRGDDGLETERESVRVPPDEHVSFGTYFGAFPAGVWRRTTAADTVRLNFIVDGSASVRVVGTDLAGVTSTVLEGGIRSGAIDLELELTDDLGWLWLEARSEADPVTVGSISWSVRGTPAADGSVAICITTFDREADCVRLLDRLASDDAVLRLLGRVIVVDQGTRPLRDQPGLDAATERLGGRLHLVEQPNLGGSGGFSRGMIAAAEGPETWALLLDDDVDLEPESIARLVALANSARRPVIAGAHMLSLTDPTVVHSWGEHIDRRAFWWGPFDPALAPVDVAQASLESMPALSAPLSVDFNGWWMCLIPTATIREIGASLPLFIKWDDAEYGLRAASVGVPTITLPGAALWHMPWTGKDNALDWQAYFHLRNRLVTALIHGTGRPPMRLLANTLAQDLNHLLCLQYGSVRARHRALRDVLSGPAHLAETIARRRADVQQILAASGQLPVAEAPVTTGMVRSARPGASTLLRAGLHQLRRSPRADAPLQTALESGEGKWWRLGDLDSAALASASGTGWFVLRRDRRAAARLLADSIGLHLRLLLRWPTLAKAYRTAAPALSSPESWRTLFER